METSVCLYDCIGRKVEVCPKDGDPFSHEFLGTIVGVHNKLLQVRDQDENVWEVEYSQIRFID